MGIRPARFCSVTLWSHSPDSRQLDTVAGFLAASVSHMATPSAAVPLPGSDSRGDRRPGSTTVVVSL